MIETMKKVFVVSKLQDKTDMLHALRDAGLLHVKLIKDQASRNMEVLSQKRKELEKVRNTLEEVKTKDKQKVLDEVAFKEVDEELADLIRRKKQLIDDSMKYNQQLSSLSAYGDYNPEDLAIIRNNGIKIYFYSMGKKEFSKLGKEISFIRLKDVSKQVFIAVLDEKLPKSGVYVEYTPSNISISKINKELINVDNELKEIDIKIKEGHQFLDSYKQQLEEVRKDYTYETVYNNTLEDGELCYLQGFVPEDEIDNFKALSKKNQWAYLMDDVTLEDQPPTKVKYNRVSKLSEPIFRLLGTVPGYSEYDISTLFLLFFSVFFAMLVGDAGYGFLFLIATIALQKKSGKVTNIVMLLYVLSGSTIIWGAMTGTWFGSEAILSNVKFLQLFVVKQITNFPDLLSGISARDTQNAVMKFSFQLGTIHLSIACIMNIVSKAKQRNLSAIADVGWLAIIDSLYLVILLLVIQEPIDILPPLKVVGVGFLLVVVFGNQSPGVPFIKGVSKGLGGLFNTFLDTISSFGNIMSYIRLFAVGMATLAIAESFNSMAAPMLSGFALPAGIIILVLGHGLNIAMAMLSVIVHGVRLNLLEFSGQLGMEWTGTLYEPFNNN